MHHFTVTAERDGRWWGLQCVEYPNALSQSRTIAEAERIFPEAIEAVSGIPQDDIEITIVPILDDEVRKHLDAAKRLRDESARANAQAAEESRRAARELHAAGLTVRDTGFALGVSYQRAAQLING